MTKKNDLKQELIEAIQNEELQFNMSTWKVGWHNAIGTPATCNTASCMAGHIEALRPKLAKKLASKYISTYIYHGDIIKEIDHAALANEIWETETGEKCQLDFIGNRFNEKKKDEDWSYCADLNSVTRKEAIAHIRGRSKKWPLLPKS